MKITYDIDKNGDQLYSGTIHHSTTHGGPFRNEIEEFTTKLLDVRDGGFNAVLVKKGKKEYMHLTLTGARKKIKEMLAASEKSKYIPTKQKIEIK